MIVSCMCVLGRKHQRPSCLPDPQLRKRRLKGLFGNLLPIELYTHHARAIGLGFQHARQGAQLFADGPRLPLVADPFDRPQHMAISLGDGSARSLRDVADAAQGKDFAVIVDAKQGRLVPFGQDDMRLLDSRPHREIGCQPLNTGVVGVRDFGKDERYIEL